jgi:hypothetical protein
MYVIFSFFIFHFSFFISIEPPKFFGFLIKYQINDYIIQQNLQFHLGLFKFNPFGVEALTRPFPRFHLGLFIFNPYGVGALLGPSPRFHLGLFIFNPYRGWYPHGRTKLG